MKFWPENLNGGKRPVGKNWCRERNNAEINVNRFVWRRTGSSIVLL